MEYAYYILSEEEIQAMFKRAEQIHKGEIESPEIDEETIQ